MEQDIDQETAQANEKLMRKRAELGIVPGSRMDRAAENTMSIMSLVSERTRRLIEENLCPAHELSEPCPVCLIEREKAEREKEAELQRRIEARKKKIEPILEACGVGKRHVRCSFEGFNGDDGVTKAIRETLLEYAMDGTSVVLQGGTGCGKTHLAVAMLRELVKIARVNSDRDARFITAPELLLEIRSSFQEGSIETEECLVDRYANARYLVIDDIGAEYVSEWSNLDSVCHHRQEKPAKIVQQSTRRISNPEQMISRMRERIASRLAEAVQIKLDFPDYRRSR